jgi:hypothetical protein
MRGTGINKTLNLLSCEARANHRWIFFVRLSLSHFHPQPTSAVVVVVASCLAFAIHSTTLLTLSFQQQGNPSAKADSREVTMSQDQKGP